MKRGFLFVIIAAVTLALGVMTPACSSNQTTAETTSLPASSAVKPKPVVQSVDATTSGMGENYYAILNITVKNEGATGTVIVVGRVTQGAQTTENSFPVNIREKGTEIIPLVFKLTWQGANWTPTVTVTVP